MPKGIPISGINKGWFKKGNIPHNKYKKGLQIAWNKGLKNVYSEEYLQKLRESAKLQYKKEIPGERKLKMVKVMNSIIVKQKMKKIWKSKGHRKKISAGIQHISLEDWKGFKVIDEHYKNFTNTFKNQIRQRDNQVCMNCGKHREKLNRALDIHHINYDKLLSIPENCISLCISCHALTNNNREYWVKLFQEKLSKLYGYKYINQNILIDLKGGNFYG